jgi:hypothetical protein
MKQLLGLFRTRELREYIGFATNLEGASLQKSLQSLTHVATGKRARPSRLDILRRAHLSRRCLDQVPTFPLSWSQHVRLLSMPPQLTRPFNGKHILRPDGSFATCIGGAFQGSVAESMGEAGQVQPYSVFFPSLSREILWKAVAVSRVRFAAQNRAPLTPPRPSNKSY